MKIMLVVDSENVLAGAGRWFRDVAWPTAFRVAWWLGVGAITLWLALLLIGWILFDVMGVKPV